MNNAERITELLKLRDQYLDGASDIGSADYYLEMVLKVEKEIIALGGKIE